MRRRTFLAALGSSVLVASIPRLARAHASFRLKSIARDALGATLSLGLPHAPFAGFGYDDDTVFAFVPAHYRYRTEEGVAALVHFHGHNTSAERAMAAHELREQLADSRQNAILVVPQLAVFAADSSCGRLEAAGGLERLLGDVVPAVASTGRVTLGECAFPEDAPLGTVCVSAHSGGYHAAACALRSGNVEVRETYLFDALYAETDAFRDWVVARRGEPLHRRHKLVSYFTEGGTTEVMNQALRSRRRGDGGRGAFAPRPLARRGGLRAHGPLALGGHVGDQRPARRALRFRPPAAPADDLVREQERRTPARAPPLALPLC
jgi:hypothetical protein